MDYSGKFFSVVGDSISTLEGYIPEGYALYYDENNRRAAGVHSPADTWWGQVIDHFGGRLLVNNSWSGSTVSYHAEFTPGSFAQLDSRMSLLGRDGIAPDVVMIYMGVNDWASGTAIFPGEGVTEEESFDGSYRIMLRKIKKYCPDAEIWCITPAVSTMRGDPSFEFPYFLGGRHLSEYVDTIKRVAREENCAVLDINDNDEIVEAIDGIHPDSEGMKTMSRAIIRRVSEIKGEV